MPIKQGDLLYFMTHACNGDWLPDGDLLALSGLIENMKLENERVLTFQRRLYTFQSCRSDISVVWKAIGNCR